MHVLLITMNIITTYIYEYNYMTMNILKHPVKILGISETTYQNGLKLCIALLTDKEKEIT